MPADGAFGETAPATRRRSSAWRWTIDGPFGSFGVPPEAGRVPLLLVAGGTGIAPIRAR